MFPLWKRKLRTFASLAVAFGALANIDRRGSSAFLNPKGNMQGWRIKKSKSSSGFRDPPDKVTYAGAIYMARIIEMRKFMSFVFRVISSYPQVTKHLTEESKQKFAFEADKYPVVEYDFSAHRQFVNEILLSRAVETFDL